MSDFIISQVPIKQFKIYANNIKEKQQIVLNDFLGDIALPAQIAPDDIDANTASVVILPLTGGGRGPVINNGETITTELLKTLLTNVITTNELGTDLNTLLGYIPVAKANSKEQEGFATHNDIITLSHDWSGYPPKIELSLAFGSIINVVNTQVGVDPTCITYFEVPQQEILFGHSGIVNDNQFTIKAAILEKSSPVINTLNWSPADIVGPPLTAITTESPLTNTTVDCVGFRVKGTLGVSNNLSYSVDGTMFAQVSIDSNNWVNLARFRWRFEDNDTGIKTENFDSFIMVDQTAHDYKFRGYLILESDDELNRELTGSIHIDTVAEVGSGTILSNDVQLKWRAKE